MTVQSVGLTRLLARSQEKEDRRQESGETIRRGPEKLSLVELIFHSAGDDELVLRTTSEPWCTMYIQYWCGVRETSLGRSKKSNGP